MALWHYSQPLSSDAQQPDRTCVCEAAARDAQALLRHVVHVCLQRIQLRQQLAARAQPPHHLRCVVGWVSACRY